MKLWAEEWFEIYLRQYNIRYYISLEKFGKKKILEIAKEASKLPVWTGPGDQKAVLSSYKNITYIAWGMSLDHEGIQKHWIMIDSKLHFERGLQINFDLLRTPISDGSHRHGNGICPTDEVDFNLK